MLGAAAIAAVQVEQVRLHDDRDHLALRREAGAIVSDDEIVVLFHDGPVELFDRLDDALQKVVLRSQHVEPDEPIGAVARVDPMDREGGGQQKEHHEWSAGNGIRAQRVDDVGNDR